MHCMLFLHNFPHNSQNLCQWERTQDVIISKAFKLFWLCDSKLFNHYIKKAHINHCPKLRHEPSKIRYKFVLVLGQNITNYFCSSISELYIYLQLINLHLIIEYIHFYHYIPFSILFCWITKFEMGFLKC